MFYLTRILVSTEGEVRAQATLTAVHFIFLLTALDLKPEDVAQANVDKLEARYGKR